MKVERFGTIKGNSDGGVNISGFTFYAENPYELGQENNVGLIAAAIIRYLSDKCEISVIDPPFDRQSEMIVLQALQKARTASDA